MWRRRSVTARRRNLIYPFSKLIDQPYTRYTIHRPKTEAPRRNQDREMGAAESRRAAAAADDDQDDPDPDAAVGDHARLVRVPGSLAGGQAELHAAVAALASHMGGPLAGAEDRGGIELEVRASRVDEILLILVSSVGVDLPPPPPPRTHLFISHMSTHS